MPQGSILGPLIFILHINDLKNVSNALDHIISADDTNLFVSDKNVNTLFTKANLELQKMNEWFKANKLSVFSLYHKSNRKGYLPLALPIRIDSVELKRKYRIKLLGFLLDEMLTWKDHKNTTENKISKNIVGGGEGRGSTL